MKNLLFSTAALTVLSAVLFSCGPALPPVTDVQETGPRLTTITFTSAALARGTSPGMTDGVLAVLVPASYATSPERRYPVVYTFHGYGDAVEQMIQLVAPVAEAAEGVPEFLMVGVYGSNRFYADSQVTGDAARMVVEEAVPLIDSRYRTVATAQGRMVAGYSMGGFGAWNLGLAHPDVFGSVWSVCPGAFDPSGLKDALATWDRTIFSDYVAVFAPDHYDAKNRSAERPLFDGSAADSAFIAGLEGGFGDVGGKLKAYHAKGTALRAIRFDYGTLDGYDWIPRGTEYVAAQMKEAGLPVSLEGRSAGHQITDAMVTDGFIPLVRQVFSGL